LRVVEEALIKSGLAQPATDAYDKTIIFENISGNPEFGKPWREGLSSHDLVKILTILYVLYDSPETADSSALGEVLFIRQECIVFHLDLQYE
jgi:hypothetical protein